MARPRRSRATPWLMLKGEAALVAPPAAIEGLHLRPGLWIGVGVCNWLPSGAPGAVNVVTPNLAVAVGPAHHNPRGLHYSGVRRRRDGKRDQQRGEGERYSFHRKSPPVQ